MDNQAAKVRLLAVSRDSEVLHVIRTAAESNLWQLTVASNSRDAMEKLQSDFPVDVLLTDFLLDEADGFRWLRSLRRVRPALPILLIDRFKPANTRLQSIEVDSNDYLVSPLGVSQLQAAILRSASFGCCNSPMNLAVNGVTQHEDGLLFIGASPKMHRVTAQVALLAETDLPAFISGEPGSGKGNIALLLHQLSSRAGSIFSKVNCATLSRELLEREIFGYEAPRGARVAGNVRGKIELSAGGTLFLDEIEEMPSELQSRLANVMANGRLVRTRDFLTVGTDVRVVAGSSLPFDQAISEHRIVPELSRQFGGGEVRVPPLRERKEELPLLARHYMCELSREFGLAPREFSATLEETWLSHHWPGNLKELEQSVKRFLAVGGTTREAKNGPAKHAREVADTVRPESFSLNPSISSDHEHAADMPGYKSLRSITRTVREQAERAAISSALEQTGWNRKAAARLLNVSYRSILYKIEQYEICPPDRATASDRERFSAARLQAGAMENKATVEMVMPVAVRGTF